MNRKRCLTTTSKRIVTLAAAALCLGALLPGPAAARTWDTVLDADYTSGAGTLHYIAYAPPGDNRGRPLLVWLHGCNDMLSTDSPPPADLVRNDILARLARDRGFVVVYPIQSPAMNPFGCWNVIDGRNQHRDTGEPALIAGITDAVRTRFHLDPTRTYITGHSAGGMMATIMGAAYPDRYAALGTWCSGAYAAGSDITGTAAFHEMGPRARPLPVLLIETRTDPFSSLPIGRAATTQWIGTDELAAGHPQLPLPAPVATEHRNPNPASGFRDSATSEIYLVGHTRIELITLDAGGHNLSGDLDGVARTTIDFLLRQRQP